MAVLSQEEEAQRLAVDEALVAALEAEPELLGAAVAYLLSKPEAYGALYRIRGSAAALRACIKRLTSSPEDACKIEVEKALRGLLKGLPGVLQPYVDAMLAKIEREMADSQFVSIWPVASLLIMIFSIAGMHDGAYCLGWTMFVIAGGGIAAAAADWAIRRVFKLFSGDETLGSASCTSDATVCKA